MALLGAAPAAHADAGVAFGGALGRTYAPANVRIAPGETITWSGSFTAHPLASARASEAYAKASGADPYPHTFATAGIYRYYCALHGAKTGENAVAGMSGEVVVTANTPPTAVIAASATTVASGTTVTFDASASSDAQTAVTHAWDLDDDGQFDDAAGPTASRAFTAAPGSTVVQTVVLKVTDLNADEIGPESNVATVAITVVGPGAAPPTGGSSGQPAAGGVGGGTEPAAQDRTAPAGRLLARALTLRLGRIRALVATNEAATVRAVLRRNGRTLASASARIVRRGTVRLVPTKAGRSLRRGRRVGATLRLTFTDATGNAATVSRAVTVKRA